MSTPVHPLIPLLTVCFSYIVFLGLLAKLRRERLSAQFALEALALTAILAGVMLTTRFTLHPALNLFLLYVVTMRSRLLTEVGTFFARRGQFQWADLVFNLAQRSLPDRNAAGILKINQAVALIQQERLNEAVAMLEELLKGVGAEYLGAKHEAALHYNLGIAYRKLQKDALATVELNKAIEAMPLSEYALRAERALQEKRNSTGKS
jgi:tetratricopeptide (TPR) repeat protein